MAGIQEEPEAPNVPQLNWGIILQGLQNISSQTALIPNVPAINQGDRILVDLNQLSPDVAADQGEKATLQQEQTSSTVS